MSPSITANFPVVSWILLLGASAWDLLLPVVLKDIGVPQRLPRRMRKKIVKKTKGFFQLMGWGENYLVRQKKNRKIIVIVIDTYRTMQLLVTHWPKPSHCPSSISLPGEFSPVLLFRMLNLAWDILWSMESAALVLSFPHSLCLLSPRSWKTEMPLALCCTAQTATEALLFYQHCYSPKAKT